MQETQVQSLGQEDSPGRGNGNPLQYSCLGKCYGQKCLADYCPWGRKELDTTERQCNAKMLTWLYQEVIDVAPIIFIG